MAEPSDTDLQSVHDIFLGQRAQLYSERDATQMISENFKVIMQYLNLDPDTEPGIEDTPKRVARFLKEFRQPCDLKELLKGFTRPTKENSMVLVKGIQLGGLCEHHFCPFFGKMHIGYIPDGNEVGLSKFQRLVNAACRVRPSIQEKLTDEIADVIMEVVKPKGVMVIADDIIHTCMVVRGVSTQGVTTTTSAVRGLFRDVPHAKAELLSLIR